MLRSLKIKIKKKIIDSIKNAVKACHKIHLLGKLKQFNNVKLEHILEKNTSLKAI